MPYVLKGQLQMSDVANLLYSISRAYCESRFRLRNSADIVYWDGDMIKSGEEQKFPDLSGSYIKTNYQTLAQRRQLGELRPRAPEMAMAVNTYLLDNKKWRMHVKTRAVNKTLLEDMVSGQTIPSPVNEYVIGTWEMDWCTTREFEDYIGYRDALLGQAQKRLKQNVSDAVTKIMNDLR